MSRHFMREAKRHESASQANMDKFYDTNAPGITLNDTYLPFPRSLLKSLLVSPLHVPLLLKIFFSWSITQKVQSE